MTRHPLADPANPADALISAQFAALRLLEAELLALARLIPGAPPAPRDTGPIVRRRVRPLG